MVNSKNTKVSFKIIKLLTENNNKLILFQNKSIRRTWFKEDWYFSKYIDDLEKEKQISAELAGKTYKGIISPEFQWGIWAVPKGADGRLDHHKALTGDDLTDFVN